MLTIDNDEKRAEVLINDFKINYLNEIKHFTDNKRLKFAQSDLYENAKQEYKKILHKTFDGESIAIKAIRKISAMMIEITYLVENFSYPPFVNPISE